MLRLLFLMDGRKMNEIKITPINRVSMKHKIELIEEAVEGEINYKLISPIEKALSDSVGLRETQLKEKGGEALHNLMICFIYRLLLMIDHTSQIKLIENYLWVLKNTNGEPTERIMFKDLVISDWQAKWKDKWEQFPTSGAK